MRDEPLKPGNNENHAKITGANAGGRGQLDARGRPRRSVLSLIWLQFVKQAVALLSESFHCSSGLRPPSAVLLRRTGHRGFSESETGTL